VSDPVRTYLDFERPIAGLDAGIEELGGVLSRSGAETPDAAGEIAKLRQKSKGRLETLYSKLDAWRKIMVARRPACPHLCDYISALVTGFEQLAGDRRFAGDEAFVMFVQGTRLMAKSSPYRGPGGDRSERFHRRV